MPRDKIASSHPLRDPHIRIPFCLPPCFAINTQSTFDQNVPLQALLGPDKRRRTYAGKNIQSINCQSAMAATRHESGCGSGCSSSSRISATSGRQDFAPDPMSHHSPCPHLLWSPFLPRTRKGAAMRRNERKKQANRSEAKEEEEHVRGERREGEKEVRTT